MMVPESLQISGVVDDQADKNLTILILTYNEEKHIERCLVSAFQVAQQVFVVDSFSTDRTLAIAQFA